MPITDTEGWDRYVAANTDPYGGCCVNVAREVMRLLDALDSNDYEAHDLVCQADRNIKAGGITGFMAGCVAQMVSQVHSRGEEFKSKWNKSYGAEDAKGVVNPAVLTVGFRE